MERRVTLSWSHAATTAPLAPLVIREIVYRLLTGGTGKSHTPYFSATSSESQLGFVGLEWSQV